MVDNSTLADVSVEVTADLRPLEQGFAKARQQAEQHNRDMRRLTASDWAKIHTERLEKQLTVQQRAARQEIESARRRTADLRANTALLEAETRARRQATEQATRHAAAMRSELLLTNRLARGGAGGGGRGPGGGPIIPIVPPLRDTEHGITGVGRAASAATLFVRGFIGAIGVHTATQLAGSVVEILKTTASIKDVAEQAGLSTMALQEFRGISGQVGLSAGEMDQAFIRFADTLGEVATSATRESKLFDLLGIKLKDLGGNAKSNEQLFTEFIGKMGEVGDASQRNAALALVFGETLGPKMAQLVNAGVGKIDEYRAALRELGIVMSEDEIQKADETWKKFDQLKLVLSTQTAQAVVANADAIYMLASALASIAGVAVKAAASLANFFQIASQPMPEAGGRTGFGVGFGMLTNPAGTIGRLGFDWGSGQAGLRQSRPSATVTLPAAGGQSKKAGGIDLSSLFAPKGRKGRGRSAPENIFSREEVQAEQERLRLLRAATADIQRRNEIDHRLIDLKLQEEFIQIDRQVKDKRLTAAQGKQLKAAETINAQLEREAADREMRADMVEREAQTAQELADAERDMLDIALRLARTDKERDRIEASLLQIKQQEEMREIDRQIALAKIAEDEKRIAELTELRRKALERQAGETKAFAKEHLRGIEKFRDELPQTVDQINEQIERIRFDLFTEKLQEAARLAEDIGDAFGQAAGRLANFEKPFDVLKGLLQDLSRTLTEQFIVKPVSDWATQAIGAPLAKKTIGKDLLGPDALTVQQMNMALDMATLNLHGLSSAAAAAAAAMGGSGGAGAAGAGASAAADQLAQSANATSQGFQSLDPQLSQFGNGLMQILSGVSGGGGGGGLAGILGMGLQLAAGAFGGGTVSGIPLSPTDAAALYPGIDPMFLGFADGGWIGGHGTGTSDSMPIWASLGEHMTNARAAKAFAPVLDGINSGRIPSMPALGKMMGGQQVDARRYSFGNFNFPGIRDAREARQAERHMVSTLQRELGLAQRAGYRDNK